MRVVCLQVCWAAPVSPVLPRTTAPCCWRRRPGCCTWEAEERCTPSTPPTSPHLETSRWVSRRREPRHGHAMAAARHISQVFSRFSSADGGQTNNSLKQIEQNPIVFLQFYGYRIKRARRLFKGLLKRVRAQWRCQNIKCVSFSFLSSCLYHTHTCFLPLSLHSSFYLSIFPSLFIERTESSLSPPPLFADWLGCFPWTEEAVSKQRQRQSGTSLQLFSLLLLLLLLFRHFFFEKHLEGFICLLSYYWKT